MLALRKGLCSVQLANAKKNALETVEAMASTAEMQDLEEPNSDDEKLPDADDKTPRKQARTEVPGTGTGATPATSG